MAVVYVETRFLRLFKSTLPPIDQTSGFGVLSVRKSPFVNPKAKRTNLALRCFRESIVKALSRICLYAMAQFDREASIERIDNPQPDTEERRKQADVIESEWGKETTITEMAEKAGYSRQHVINTLESHFRIVEEEPETEREIQGDTVEIPTEIINDEKAVKAFCKGYEAGFRLAKA